MNDPVVGPVGATPVGDITSTAKGSGARANAGKTPYELLPILALSDVSGEGIAHYRAWWDRCLHRLGEWQAGNNDALVEALRETQDPPEVIKGFETGARVFDYGRRKYNEWNWAKGMLWSVPFACAIRHIEKLQLGEENDQESGLPHRGHIQCNLMMLIQYARTYKEGDDRPTQWLGGDHGQAQAEAHARGGPTTPT